MNRYYLVNKEPKLISLLELIDSMAKDGVLECDQSQLERIVRLEVDKLAHIEDETIKRVI
jgi:hypothetical protein|tara:strand:- start:220 stop:399 length:180 start_codon:yes stop_codon:yes gene_type:complete